MLGLADKHGRDRLEAACGKALAAGDPSYRTVKGILAAGLERTEHPRPTGDGGAAAHLHGHTGLFANVVAMPTATGTAAVPGATSDSDQPPQIGQNPGPASEPDASDAAS